jgi:N-acetylmuramoyl-L-alanine amidase
MMKRSILFLSIVLSVPALFSFVAYKSSGKQKVKTIIVDPGHGGYDQGASGTYSTEAQICLAVGTRLGPMLEKEFPGVKVRFTRTTDIIPGNSANKNAGLKYRANFANESSGDLFIALHCNSNGRRAGGWNEKYISDYTYKSVVTGKGKKKKTVQKKYPVYSTRWVENKTRGTETYVWAARESGHKEDMINPDAEDYSGENDSTLVIPDADSPEMKALQLIYNKKYFKGSVTLATFIEEEFRKTGRNSRGVKQRNDVGIWVLHATGMPSILVEMGFITNKEEEDYMNSKDGQQEICDCIIKAVRNYLNWLDKGSQQNGNNNPDTKGDTKKPHAVNNKQPKEMLDPKAKKPATSR